MNIEHRAFLKLKLVMRDEPGYRPSYGAVFEQLQYLENANTGHTCPGQGVLARCLGYARETVNRATRWLESRGYIKTEQRFRRIAANGVRFLSKRYWIARELGQVAHLLRAYAQSARRVYHTPKKRPILPIFSSDRKVSPPSTPVYILGKLVDPAVWDCIPDRK